jgi:hypothetical protein
MPEMQQDEAAALLALNSIHDAEAYYRRRHPADGFVCSLVALQPDTAGYSPGAYVGSNLATGQSAGYKFDFVNCSQSTVKHRLVFADYEVVAVPAKPGISGQNGYCLYADGSIRKDSSGGTNCTESVQAAKD